MKKVTARQDKPTTSTKSEKKQDYVELRIPRISFRNTPINVYLVFSLVIFAFLLGMLTNKVLVLEKQVKTAGTAPVAAGDPAAALPTEAPAPQIVDVEEGKLPLFGEKDAKVKIVIFSDFECPFCKRYFDDAHAQIVKDYVDTGKVALAFRHYPLNSIHPNAQKAGEAAECANEQGNFWAYHDELFNTQESWSQKTGADVLSAFTEVAGGLGLDTTQFQSCIESDKYATAVSDDAAAGEAVQVSGTPSFFINGYRVVGAVPYADLKKVIEQELKK